MNQTSLINTMDFNFMDVLSHALHQDARLVIEYLFSFMDDQPQSMDNYNLIIMNLEELLHKSRGAYLAKFLDDDHQGTTFRIVIDDESLDPNQHVTTLEYFQYDHSNIKGMGQIVDRFKQAIRDKKDEEDDRSESFKV